MQLKVRILDHNEDLSYFVAAFDVNGETAFIAQRSGHGHRVETSPVGESDAGDIDQVLTHIEVAPGVHCPFAGERVPMPLDLYVQREHTRSVLRSELEQMLGEYRVRLTGGDIELTDPGAETAQGERGSADGYLLNDLPFERAYQLFEQFTFETAALESNAPSDAP